MNARDSVREHVETLDMVARQTPTRSLYTYARRCVADELTSPDRAFADWPAVIQTAVREIGAQITRSRLTTSLTTYEPSKGVSEPSVVAGVGSDATSLWRHRRTS